MLSGGRQLLTFRIANEQFALPAAAVREVVRPAKTTRVPHAPECLIGLANLRGKVIPIVSLGALLERDVTGGDRVIVLERADPVGLLVDEVFGVAADNASEIRVIDAEEILAKAFSGGRGGARSARVGAVARLRQADAAIKETVLLVFTVAGQDYALPIADVEEVTQFPTGIAPLPLADAAAVGTVARDDGLLPLLSLRLLLGFPGAGDANRQQVLVVRIGEHRVGLVIDVVRAILHAPDQAIDAVPSVLTRGQGEASIQAICRLDGGKRLISILAVEHLVRADLTTKLLENTMPQGEAMPEATDRTRTEQFLIFQVGGQEFGMPVGVVREVTRLPAKLTRLPKSPAFVEGVMNLRGTVIPVIDQSRRFDNAPVAGKRRRVIVAALGESEAGFLVDSVSDVLRIPVEAIGPAPDLGDERTRVFDRVANLESEGRVILIVEPQELLDRAERDLLLAMTAKDGTRAS